MKVSITTPLFTANQGVENDEFNRRVLPENKQQDQFQKNVYDPVAVLRKRYERTELPETCKYLARPQLKKILGTKPPPLYQSPPLPSTDAEDRPTFGRIISTMPELPSQRHVNCFDGDFEPKAGENINALWNDRTVAFGSMSVNTQQKFLEEKQEESLRGFQPRKWKMDVETKIEEDQLKKKVESRMKEFGAGFQLPFVPCEKITRMPMRSSSEIWRHKPLPPKRGGGGGGGSTEEDTVEKFKLLMSRLHQEEIWLQKTMEATPSLVGQGNRIIGKCARQEYLTRPLDNGTCWHKDVLSSLSQLHGYAVPYLQTLPENLRTQKAMANAAWRRYLTEAPTPEAPQDAAPTNVDAGDAGDAPHNGAEIDANEEMDATQPSESMPPPPGNTPLPPIDVEETTEPSDQQQLLAPPEQQPQQDQMEAEGSGEMEGDEQEKENDTDGDLPEAGAETKAVELAEEGMDEETPANHEGVSDAEEDQGGSPDEGNEAVSDGEGEADAEGEREGEGGDGEELVDNAAVDNAAGDATGDAAAGGEEELMDAVETGNVADENANAEQQHRLPDIQSTSSSSEPRVAYGDSKGAQRNGQQKTTHSILSKTPHTFVPISDDYDASVEKRDAAQDEYAVKDRDANATEDKDARRVVRINAESHHQLNNLNHNAERPSQGAMTTGDKSSEIPLRTCKAIFPIVSNTTFRSETAVSGRSSYGQEINSSLVRPNLSDCQTLKKPETVVPNLTISYPFAVGQMPAKTAAIKPRSRLASRTTSRLPSRGSLVSRQRILSREDAAQQRQDAMLLRQDGMQRHDATLLRQDHTKRRER